MFTIGRSSDGHAPPASLGGRHVDLPASNPGKVDVTLDAQHHSLIATQRVYCSRVHGPLDATRHECP